MYANNATIAQFPWCLCRSWATPTIGLSFEQHGHPQMTPLNLQAWAKIAVQENSRCQMLSPVLRIFWTGTAMDTSVTRLLVFHILFANCTTDSKQAKRDDMAALFSKLCSIIVGDESVRNISTFFGFDLRVGGKLCCSLERTVRLWADY